tara:strand:- start:1209 stop:1472 length:264 start_codon:yes stop_codon:yes gene_type:complete
MKIMKTQLQRIIKEELVKEIDRRPPSVSDDGPGFDPYAEPPPRPDVPPHKMKVLLQQYMDFMDYFDRPDNKEVISQAAEIIAGYGDF